MSEHVPAWRVSLDPATAKVFEIITDTGQTILDRSRPELAYQDAYAAILERTRSMNSYVTEQSGMAKRFLQIRENGHISVVDSLPELPSDAVSPPPFIPATIAREREAHNTPAAGGIGSRLKGALKPSAPTTATATTAPGPAQRVKVKVKVPQAVLYGASGGSLLIGLSAGIVIGLFL